MLNFIMTDPSTESVEDANTSTDQSTPTLRAISTTDKKKKLCNTESIQHSNP